MLLKTHYSHEPPEFSWDSLGPAVAEQIDEAPQEGGGGTDDEVVFKTSPALQSLNIPVRRPPTPAVTDEPAPDQPPPASSLRWPVALVVSTAIVVVGFLAYKKMYPPQTTVSGGAQEPAARASFEEPAAAPGGGIADAAQVAALAPSGDGGAGPGEGEDGGAALAANGDEAAPTAGRRGRSRRARRKGKRENRGAEPKQETSAAAPPAAPAARAAPKKGAPRGKSSLDSLIDTAIGSPAPAKKAAAAPAAPASDLPDQLTMNQIRAAMNKVKPRVQACYDQHQVEGMAQVRFKINPDGSVADLSIRGKFRGTETGDCVLKAVRKATFAKFSGKAMTIQSYPFLLQ